MSERKQRYTWGDEQSDDTADVVKEGTGEAINLDEHLADLQEKKQPAMEQLKKLIRRA